jgi:hypothetical protein
MTAWYGGLILVYALITPLLPNHNPNGQCDGIGWGCTLTPRESAVLVGLYIGIPAIVVGVLISLGVYALSRRPMRRHPVLMGTAAALIGIVVGVSIVLAHP